MNRATPTGGAELPAPKAPVPASRPLRIGRYLGGGLFLLLLLAFIGPIEPGIPPRRAWHNIEMQQVRAISLALLQYEQDHHGKFPPGESSTAVFQQLLDGKEVDYYGMEPSLFYFPMKGKTPALEGQALKPENVSFDVTSPLDDSDPEDLPLVFSTGFRVTYEPDALAERLTVPDFRMPGFEWFRPDPGPLHDRLIVCNRRAEVRMLIVREDASHPNGAADGFMPADFKSNGKSYRQLTPDGPMPTK